jgi:hypothetical protein
MFPTWILCNQNIDRGMTDFYGSSDCLYVKWVYFKNWWFLDGDEKYCTCILISLYIDDSESSQCNEPSETDLPYPCPSVYTT